MLQPYLGIGPTRRLLSQYYANGDQSGCWFGRHAHELAKIVRLASATVLSKHANNSVNTMTGSIPAALNIDSYPASAQNMRLTYDRHNQCHIDHRAVVTSTAYSTRQNESDASHQGRTRHPVCYIVKQDTITGSVMNLLEVKSFIACEFV